MSFAVFLLHVLHVCGCVPVVVLATTGFGAARQCAEWLLQAARAACSDDFGAQRALLTILVRLERSPDSSVRLVVFRTYDLTMHAHLP